jgi:uncharacterized protein (DUF302 family)
MSQNTDHGIVSVLSKHSVDATVERLKGLLTAKGITVFTVIDHSGEAERAGLEMRPTKLVVFGSPRAGTPLMVATPTLAIDLPLKALVWQDADGRVWLSWNSPEYLRERHGIPDDLLKNIASPGALLQQAAD